MNIRGMLDALLAVELAIYWGTVVVKSIRLARKIGRDPNVIPREATGRRLRLIWVPTILAWCTVPWVNALLPANRFPEMLRPLGAFSPLGLAVAVLAIVIGAIALAATFVCWRKMGRSWRIGIDPSEKTQLIITGPYRLVRHPIYALSVVLMLCSVAAIPSGVMLVLAAIHILMLQLEARREEAYLTSVHGSDYLSYMQSVGRFIPRRRNVS